MRTIPGAVSANPKAAKNVEVQNVGLVEADSGGVYQEPLIVGSFGRPGSGKSRLLGTAPGAIGLIPTESKSRQTVLEIARKFDKKVFLPAIDGKETSLIRTANPMLLASMPKTCIVIGDEKHKNWKPGEIQDEMQRIAETISVTSPHPICCQRHYYRWHVDRVKYVAYQMLEHSSIKTIGIDPFGTFVDDVSMANYGLTGVIDPKEFGFAPREDMIREIREFLNNLSQKNLVLTHHAKNIWVDGKPTKKWEVDGKFSKIGHYTSVMVEMVRDDDAEEGAGRYVMKVKDCQANAELVGQDLLTDDDIMFSTLAQLVYPESDEETWS